VTPLERLGLCALHRFDPERAHELSLKALRSGLVPLPGVVSTPRLATDLAGLKLANPVGLAAGFDKNAVALHALARAGFGWLEVGAATPRPQPGNPRPRLFRLTEDRAAINRFGFNNEGAQAIAARLATSTGILWLDVVQTFVKGALSGAADFARVLEICGPHLDFATVNVSSPNTEKLRDLQGKEALSALLAGVLTSRDALARRVPIFPKIAPDLSAAELGDIAEVTLASGIDGVIATNTTLDRTGLHGPQAQEKGGLSGAPLFEKSTRMLARLSHLTEGRLPLIGVGGIANADQAYAKIQAGASAVQFYTAMVFGGIGLAAEIARGLDRLLGRDGFATVAEAVGTNRKDWL